MKPLSDANLLYMLPSREQLKEEQPRLAHSLGIPLALLALDGKALSTAKDFLNG